MHATPGKRARQGVPSFPIVGIGASAGGLQAAETFFDHTSATSGMAYVVAFHLDPAHKSAAAALLQRHTDMPVTQVKGRTRIEADHVYAIPPGHGLALRDGAVVLTPLGGNGGPATVIDRFFLSLAQHAGARAIGVVLSGAVLGGVQGLKAIKEAGGLTVAEDPAEAEYAGMPRGAIDTGLVDFVLPAQDIPAKLAAIREFAIDLTPTLAAHPQHPEHAGTDDALQEIYLQLHAHTGVDFSHYKQNTILRRVARRMQVRQVPDLASYRRLLASQPAEVDALFRELLISVTRFFRDPDAMQTLAREAALKICKRAAGKDMVRVWVPGCASGEEAYTLAMLFIEACDGLAAPPHLQFFASDVDERALAVARRGAYPEAIAEEVSAARLRRFFDHDGDRYVVKPALREIVFFTRHDLLQDPPFSRLDLISCRNLLIYLDSDIQQRVFALFHFALREEAFLFLGSSESLGASEPLFADVDRGARLYRARSAAAARLPLLPAPLLPAPLRDSRVRAASEPPRQRFGDIVRSELLSRYAPPCVIVNASYDVVYVSGRVGRYLEPGSGAANYHVLDMARAGLRRELRSGLYRAFHEGASLQAKPVRVPIDGHEEVVRLTIRPLAGAEGHALVVFAPATEAPAPQPPPVAEDSASLVAQLEAELSETRESLQATIEQTETSNEELRTSNEELQSVNEELQSTTEELESGREELQSANEELQAVNEELQARNDELARANSDLDNLIASIDVGTLFLDRELRVRRYTPRALDIFNLIPTDVGRPLAHITHRLTAEDLVADAARVLEQLAPAVRELATTDGRFYQTRIKPYRAGGDKVGGVLLTFVDVSERHRHETETRALNNRLQAQRNYAESIVATVREPMLVLDGGLRVVSANPAFHAMFSRSPEEAAQVALRTLGLRCDLAALERQLQATLQQGEPVDGVEVRLAGGEAASERVLLLNARRLNQDAGSAPLALLAFQDVTERLRMEAALREREEQKAYLLRLSDALRPLADAGAATVAAMRALLQQLRVDWAGYLEVDASGEFVDLLGNCTTEQTSGRGHFRLRDFGPGPQQALASGRPFVVADVAALPATDTERRTYEALDCRATIGMPIVKDGGQSRAILSVSCRAPRAWTPGEIALIEETAERTWEAVERARAQQALARSEEKYRALFETMDEGFCILERSVNAAGDVDFRRVEANAAFAAITRLEHPVGQSVRAGFPQDAPAAIARYEEVLASGAAVRFEQPLAPLCCIVEVHAFRLGAERVALLVQDVTERKQSERRHKLLASELNHRVRNNLAIVQTLAAQTFSDARCSATLATFDARLRALAAAHDVLTREHWKGAEVSAITRAALAAWATDGSERVHVRGPWLRLHATAALALALALHELATNASKYGALSLAAGRVTIAWKVTAGAFRMTWHEHGGPPVQPPARRGFGSWLIETGLAQDFGGSVKLEFRPHGVFCALEAPLATIRESA